MGSATPGAPAGTVDMPRVLQEQLGTYLVMIALRSDENRRRCGKIRREWQEEESRQRSRQDTTWPGESQGLPTIIAIISNLKRRW